MQRYYIDLNAWCALECCVRNEMVKKQDGGVRYLLFNIYGLHLGLCFGDVIEQKCHLPARNLVPNQDHRCLPDGPKLLYMFMSDR